MNIETSIVENFFTEEEIDYISSECSMQVEPTSSSNSGTYYPVPTQIEAFINEKITKLPGEVFFINLFSSELPCGVHADINPSTNNLADTNLLARTIIIPLDTYDSGTAVFQQQLDYGETNAAILDFPILHDYDNVSNLFSHAISNEIIRLSVEEVFYWKKGSMLTFDRRKLHCSTGFSDNMTHKKGLVIWTQIKK